MAAGNDCGCLISVIYFGNGLQMRMARGKMNILLLVVI